MSVNIIGDRTQFLSKTAILRLKTDIKENKLIEPSKYLKEGYIFKINTHISNKTMSQGCYERDNSLDDQIESVIVSDVYIESIHNKCVDVVPDEPEEVEPKEKIDLRKKLKQLLQDSRKERSGEHKKSLVAMKNTVPPKILDYYTKLVSKYKLDNLPRPDDVIKNVDKYKLQISAVIGKIGKVSDDPRVSKGVLDYFTALAHHLNIQPMNIDLSNNANMEAIANMAASSNIPQLANISRLAKDDDTDDEDTPDLVNVK